jgi:hypothetical protein
VAAEAVASAAGTAASSAPAWPVEAGTAAAAAGAVETASSYRPESSTSESAGAVKNVAVAGESLVPRLGTSRANAPCC